MRSTLTFILIYLCSFGTYLNAQQLWPGDANNNGEVNVVDVLFVGLAYGETGPTRDNATINWQAEDITTLWTSTFFNGLNHAYADCDGNGLIDKDDIKNPIKDNYGLTHGVVTPDVFSNGMGGVDVPLKLINTSGTGSLSGSMDLDINLGEASNSVNDFYGIAFSIKYDPNIIEDLEFDIDATSWIDNGSDDTHELAVKNTVTGNYDIAIIRKNQNPISGFGKIGKLNIIIEDIVVGLVTADTTIQISIENVKMLSSDLSDIPVVKDSVMITIENVTGIKSIIDLQADIKISPNPFFDFFVISSDATSIKSIHLYNLLGELVSTQQGLNMNKVTYSTVGLDDGIYFVAIETEEGIVIRKLIKN
ncbi:MAG: T9SS type A sorting domain-containing protein [Saprospiraceae bacterium]